MLINLTPHPIRIFASDCPDNIDPDEIQPLAVIHPSAEHKPARIGEIELGTVMHVPAGNGWSVPVEYVEYCAHGGLVHPLPPTQDGVWLIVSLVVAMQQTYVYQHPKGRSDLLVPYREVRNLSRTVIGCRQLARPV